jgi:Protein of unknown function (DUF1173)
MTTTSNTSSPSLTPAVDAPDARARRRPFRSSCDGFTPAATASPVSPTADPPTGRLEPSTGAAVGPAIGPQPGSDRGRRNQISLGGLTQLLWEQARLNVWWPRMTGKRNWYVVHRELTRAAAGIHLRGATQRRLDTILHVPDPYRHDQHDEHVAALDAFITAMPERGYGIVVAEHKTITRTRRGARLQLKHLPDVRCWLTPTVLARALHSYPCLANPPDGHLVITIACRPGRTTRDLDIVHLSCLLTSPEWIPVASRPEAELCALLVAGGRAFTKPLRYDAHRDAVFPDFVLIDTDVDTPLEVYGMHTPAYDRRKEAKVAWYQQSGEPWWAWDLIQHPTPPPLPPSRHPAASPRSKPRYDDPRTPSEVTSKMTRSPSTSMTTRSRTSTSARVDCDANCDQRAPR